MLVACCDICGDIADEAILTSKSGIRHMVCHNCWQDFHESDLLKEEDFKSSYQKDIEDLTIQISEMIEDIDPESEELYEKIPYEIVNQQGY